MIQGKKNKYIILYKIVKWVFREFFVKRDNFTSGPYIVSVIAITYAQCYTDEICSPNSI